MPMHKSPEFRLGKTQVVENCAVRRLVVLEKHAHDLVVGMRNAPVIPTCSPCRPFSMSKRLSWGWLLDCTLWLHFHSNCALRHASFWAEHGMIRPARSPVDITVHITCRKMKVNLWGCWDMWNDMKRYEWYENIWKDIRWYEMVWNDEIIWCENVWEAEAYFKIWTWLTCQRPVAIPGSETEKGTTPALSMSWWPFGLWKIMSSASHWWET